MEPMLDTDRTEQMISDLRPLVNQDIWLGTMNHLNAMKKNADSQLLPEIDKIETGQSPEILNAIYNTYKDDSMIKWKTDTLKKIQIN